jgi:hypothetical protein
MNFTSLLTKSGILLLSMRSCPKDSIISNICINYYQYTVKIDGRGNARRHDLVHFVMKTTYKL